MLRKNGRGSPRASHNGQFVTPPSAGRSSSRSGGSHTPIPPVSRSPAAGLPAA